MFRFFLLLPLLGWSCNTAPSNVHAPRPIDTSTSAATTPEPDDSENPAPAPVAADWEIVPGKRVGNTTLGDDPQTLLQRLGTPDASDAAMGKAWLVWEGTSSANTLAVFTAYADSTMARKAIRQIRVTSPRFQTSGGIHTTMLLSEIRQAFPTGDLLVLDSGPRYEVSGKGISFECSGKAEPMRCTAILVYPPGTSPTAYLPLPH